MKFEWDENKAQSNLQKHKVSFEIATLVFKDAFSITRQGQRTAYGEERFTILGMAKADLIVVVYTERDDRIRIISARPVNRKEKHDYYQSQASE